jgi:hypothetical protein
MAMVESAPAKLQRQGREMVWPADRVSHADSALEEHPKEKPLRILFHSPPALSMAVLGSLLQGIGVYWDIAWHIEVGRDKLFSAPHNAILAGMALVGLAATYVTARSASGDPRRLLGILALVGVGTQVVGLAVIDDWWHRLYGIDATLWSPPHLLAISAGALALYGFIGGWWIERTFVARRTHKLALGAGLVAALITTDVLLAEYDFSVPQFRLAAQPVVLAFMIVGPLVFAKELLRGKFSATAVAAAFTLSRLAMWPILGALGRSSRPYVPAALLAAIMIDIFLGPSTPKTQEASLTRPEHTVSQSPMAGVIVSSLFAGLALVATEPAWERAIQDFLERPPASATPQAYWIGGPLAIAAAGVAGLFGWMAARNLVPMGQVAVSLKGRGGEADAIGSRPGGLIATAILVSYVIFMLAAPASAHDPGAGELHDRWVGRHPVYARPIAGAPTRAYSFELLSSPATGSTTTMLVSKPDGKLSRDAWAYGFISRRCPGAMAEQGECKPDAAVQVDTRHRKGWIGQGYMSSLDAIPISLEWPGPGEYFGFLRILDGNALLAAQIHVDVEDFTDAQKLVGAAGAPIASTESEAPKGAGAVAGQQADLLEPAERNVVSLQFAVIGRTVPPASGTPLPPPWLKPLAYLLLATLVSAGIAAAIALPRKARKARRAADEDLPPSQLPLNAEPGA